MPSDTALKGSVATMTGHFRDDNEWAWDAWLDDVLETLDGTALVPRLVIFDLSRLQCQANRSRLVLWMSVAMHETRLRLGVPTAFAGVDQRTCDKIFSLSDGALFQILDRDVSDWHHIRVKPVLAAQRQHSESR